MWKNWLKRRREARDIRKQVSWLYQTWEGDGVGGEAIIHAFHEVTRVMPDIG